MGQKPIFYFSHEAVFSDKREKGIAEERDTKGPENNGRIGE